MADDRTTRMAWSTMAAVAMHAAALGSWPSFPSQLALDPNAPVQIDASEPEWIFMDQVPAGGAGEGIGPSRPDPGSGIVRAEPRGDTPVGDDPAPRGLSEDLRDRLVRATAFAPTLAENPGSEGDFPTASEEGEGVAVGGSPLAGLSPSDYEALEGLSALDLERLSSIRPDVALEALSNWVLVRNPDQVRDFILRNPSNAPRAQNRQAVSVAIWVNAAGNVEWAEIVSSSGRSEWDALALELFNDVVTFRPARLEGIPMPMSAIFTVDFPW